MARFNQEKKAIIKPQIDKILKKYGLKGSMKVHNLSSVYLTLSQGKIDFKNFYKGEHWYYGNYGVNPYYIKKHFGGIAGECLQELQDALNGKGSSIQNYDNSDAMTDYFDVGRYSYIVIGSVQKDYKVI